MLPKRELHRRVWVSPKPSSVWPSQGLGSSGLHFARSRRGSARSQGSFPNDRSGVPMIRTMDIGDLYWDSPSQRNYRIHVQGLRRRVDSSSSGLASLQGR